MTIPGWLFMILVFFVILSPLAGVFVGAWVVLQIKHPGVRLIPTETKENDTNSYLHSDLRDMNILIEEPMSDAAKEIRKQKLENHPMKEHIKEVEGLV